MPFFGSALVIRGYGVETELQKAKLKRKRLWLKTEKRASQVCSRSHSTI